MPGERLILNPVSESSANAPLELVGPDGSPDWGTLLISHDYGAPPRMPQYAGSSDTEGDPLASTRYANRVITVQVRVLEPSQAAGTNLATNPRCASGTTGWTNSGMASIGRVVLDQTSTPVGLQGAETALESVGNSDGDVAYLSASATSGQTYAFSAWVYLSASTATGVKLTARNASGTLKASSSNVTATGSWSRLSLTVTADSTATWRFGVEQVGAGATTSYATMAMIQNSSSVEPYFDGDTPGCDWSGTRHDSSSTRRASGGPRFLAALDDVQTTVDRIVREGGTLKRVPPGGKPIVFDVLDAQVDIPQGNAFISRRRADITLTLTAKPFWRRGEWIQLADNTETSAPYMSFTHTGIQGEVPAFGKLMVDEDQAQTQRWLAWGIESRRYSSAATAGVFYEAEGRTLKGNSAIVTVTGASGGASNNAIRDTDLVPTYQQILSTQATGGGDHLSHVGKWRVFARVQSASANTGTVSMRLEWGQGDFRRSSQNDPVGPVAAGNWELVDLGVVTIDPVSQGTQRWEGRLLAKSTSPGDELAVDYLWLCPVDDGSGEITAKPEVSTSYSKIVGYDLFNQTAGALSGKTANIGGNWSSTGDATDFSVVAGTTNAVQRSEVSDAANTGRYAYLATTAYAASSVSVDIITTSASTGTLKRGVMLRFVDANNWLMARVEDLGFGVSTLRVVKRVGGTITTLSSSSNFFVSNNTTYNVSLSADASGNWVAAAKLGTSTLASLSGTDTVLATGNALDDGYGGFYDEQTSASVFTRTYDNFILEQTASTDAKDDAALFASQSCEIRYDGVVREDSSGVVWSSPGKYEGDLLYVPIAGRDDRSVRFTLKAARYGPGDGADTAFDDISARLSYQPRGITTPDPS
jgi:hypothetical protein